jgi:hypothetical protein
MVRQLCAYLFIIFSLFSCNSKSPSETKNPEAFLSFYNKIPKNDSLKIEINYNRSKDRLGVCVTNISAKEIVVPFYGRINLSYNPAPGFVLFAYEEQDNDYAEISSGIDYDTSLLGDTLPDKKLQVWRGITEAVFHLISSLNFSR